MQLVVKLQLFQCSSDRRVSLNQNPTQTAQEHTPRCTPTDLPRPKAASAIGRLRTHCSRLPNRSRTPGTNS